jgi:hypothetical protein
MTSSTARAYHVRDNVHLRCLVLHYDALNEKLVFAVVICGHLLRCSHSNCMNFTDQQEQDMGMKPEESRAAKLPNQTAGKPKIPQDPLGCTMPEAGRTAYLFGFVVFTCRLGGTPKLILEPRSYAQDRIFHRKTIKAAEFLTLKATR